MTAKPKNPNRGKHRLPSRKEAIKNNASQFEQREPNARDAAAVSVAKARHESRLKRVQVLGARKGDTFQVTSPHKDEHGWLTAMHDAFGTTSRAFGDRCILELTAILRQARTEQTVNDLNIGLAVLDGIKPANETEAMLAVQMVTTHNVAMDALHRAKHADTREAILGYGGLAVKLLRTYAAQFEALAKTRRGGEQRVVVEHVHVYPGGQAIVGSVHPGRGEGISENGGRPHAPTEETAVAFAPRTALWSEDPRREVLPVSDCEGKEPMPDARRRQRERGT
jgi:hypothetical protein